MWIRVALSINAIEGEYPGYVSIVREPYEKYYFDEDVAEALEADTFLLEMWNKFDALFDWGDYDFFFPDKCERLIPWLQNRLGKGVNDTIRPVYETMLDYAQKAVKYQTGSGFDF
jgi:hypothetical protein